MNYIIDGYNLAFKDMDLSRLIKAGQTEQVIPMLIKKIQNLLKFPSGRVIIVFDGKDGYYPQNRFRSVEIKFSKKPQTADDIIRDFLRKAANPKECKLHCDKTNMKQ